jgi:hypothetical protein
VLDVLVCLNHEPIQNFFFSNMGRISKFHLYYVSLIIIIWVNSNSGELV